MLYTIGVKTNNSGEKKSGLYAFNRYGLPIILSDNRDVRYNETMIYVFQSSDDAQKCVKHLSRLYRKDFHQRAEKNECSVNDFGFHILKIESSKFKYKVSPKPIKNITNENPQYNYALHLLECNR